jgi:hypothetical protein
MSLSKRLADPNITVGELAAWLDGLTHEGRLEAMGHTSPREQKRLWEIAAGGPPITAEHFVPAGVGPRVEVIHHGRNTLPAFKSFQKRFAKPVDGSNRFFGYNEGFTRSFIGPGCFVCIDTTEGQPGWTPAWPERGAWVVDYFQVPDGPVPDGWPKVVPNHVGLQVLVYNKTRDFMRRVSSHVSIGTAFKVEKAMGAYFTLVRQDP